MAKAILEGESIGTVIVNKQDSMNPCMNTSLLIELFVNTDFVVRALRIINSKKL